MLQISCLSHEAERAKEKWAHYLASYKSPLVAFFSDIENPIDMFITNNNQLCPLYVDGT